MFELQLTLGTRQKQLKNVLAPEQLKQSINSTTCLLEIQKNIGQNMLSKSTRDLI